MRCTGWTMVFVVEVVGRLVFGSSANLGVRFPKREAGVAEGAAWAQTGSRQVDDNDAKSTAGITGGGKAMVVV